MSATSRPWPRREELALLAAVLHWDGGWIQRDIDQVVAELGHPPAVMAAVLNITTADGLYSLWERSEEGEAIVNALLDWLAERLWTPAEAADLAEHTFHRLTYTRPGPEEALPGIARLGIRAAEATLSRRSGQVTPAEEVWE